MYVLNFVFLNGADFPECTADSPEILERVTALEAAVAEYDALRAGSAPTGRARHLDTGVEPDTLKRLEALGYVE